MSGIFKGDERMEGSGLNGREKELHTDRKRLIKVKTIQNPEYFKLEITYFPHCFQKLPLIYARRVFTQPME